nr:hypothetical protein [Brevibacillus laterosporus]
MEKQVREKAGVIAQTQAKYEKLRERTQRHHRRRRRKRKVFGIVCWMVFSWR